MKVIAEKGILTPVGVLIMKSDEKILRGDCLANLLPKDIIKNVVPDILIDQLIDINIIDNQDKGLIEVFFATKNLDFFHFRVMKEIKKKKA